MVLAGVLLEGPGGCDHFSHEKSYGIVVSSFSFRCNGGIHLARWMDPGLRGHEVGIVSSNVASRITSNLIVTCHCSSEANNEFL